MADFHITIEDQSLLDGITWARTRYNASPPDEVLMATDYDYVFWLVTTAAASYAEQASKAAMATANVDGKVSDAIAAAESGDLTLLDALRDQYSNPKEAKSATMEKI